MTSIYVALIIYLVILFAVGIYYSKKNATISDFLLAGKKPWRYRGNANNFCISVWRRTVDRYRTEGV